MKWCGKSAPPGRRRSGRGKPHRVQGRTVPGWSGRWERVDRCVRAHGRSHAPARRRAGQRNDRPATRPGPRQGVGESGTELGLPSAADRHRTREDFKPPCVGARAIIDRPAAPARFVSGVHGHKEAQKAQERMAPVRRASVAALGPPCGNDYALRANTLMLATLPAARRAIWATSTSPGPLHPHPQPLLRALGSTISLSISASSWWSS